MPSSSFIDDYRDAMLEAQAELMEVMREVVKEMLMPEIRRKARQAWATLPEDMKEKFKAERPDEYQLFMEGD